MCWGTYICTHILTDCLGDDDAAKEQPCFDDAAAQQQQEQQALTTYSNLDMEADDAPACNDHGNEG